MPILDLGNWDNKIEDWVGLRVLSVMFHPKNEIYRREFIVCELLKLILESDERFENNQQFFNFFSKALAPIDVVQTLLHSPGYDEVTVRITKAGDKAFLAGEVLFGMAAIQNNFSEAKISVNKLISVLEKKRGISDRTLRKYWIEYKSTAHLWAALPVIQGKYNTETQPDYPDWSYLYHPEATLEFLGIAEYFKKIGMEYVPRAQKDPLLKENEVWHLPEGFPIDQISSLTFPKLSKAVEKALQEYQAPKMSEDY